jgi:hypothetical protein
MRTVPGLFIPSAINSVRPASAGKWENWRKLVTTNRPTSARPIPRYRSFGPQEVRLSAGTYQRRRDLNRSYLESLLNDNLLQNHYIEAGIGHYGHLRTTYGGGGGVDGAGDERHWGWETPGGQLRGHFLGHWLSAVAREVASTGDAGLRHRLDTVVAELARCQEENGGEWVFSIPTRYLDRVASGRPVWAPQYTIHKTFMGLVDAYRDGGNEQALDVARRAAAWFLRWTDGFDRALLDDILDVETGGMLEVWADLYDFTGDERYLTLLDRYDRRRLFEPLLQGVDMLTNMHANTTIPEVLGAARAYEVTGDPRWRDIVTAYWRWAVTERGTFCTGGQTSGEIWTPPLEFAARRGDKNQEHCTVYNMMRLADHLFRWTGEAEYLDYYERNAINGILAQQNPQTGMVAYFLPLAGGSRKHWGSPTYDFWCCHGTLVQAHTRHNEAIFYGDGDDEIVVARFVDSVLTTSAGGTAIEIAMSLRDTTIAASPDANASQAGSRHRPASWGASLRITAAEPVAATLRLRIPEWVVGAPTIVVDGEAVSPAVQDGFAVLKRTWSESTIDLTLPAALRAVAIPDEPGTVAFLDGPVVLAGECDHEPTLTGNPDQPETLLVPDNERQWGQWLGGYRTIGQGRSIRFRPLNEIVDQPYTVYFPVVAPR